MTGTSEMKYPNPSPRKAVGEMLKNVQSGTETTCSAQRLSRKGHIEDSTSCIYPECEELKASTNVKLVSEASVESCQPLDTHLLCCRIAQEGIVGHRRALSPKIWSWST